MILKKLARVRVFPEGHPRKWEVTLKSLKANFGRSPRRANARNVSFKLSTVASWVDNTKLPWNTLPPTQHHSFYRNYPFIQMIYYIPLVSWNLIGQLCVTRQRESLPDCGTIYFYVHDVSPGSLLCTRTCNAFTVFITELRALNPRKSD